MKRFRWVVSLMAMAGLLIGALPLALGAQEPLPATAGPTGPVAVRLYYEGRDHLNAVAAELDIWEVQQDRGYAVAAVTPEQYAWLEELGYRLEVDEARTEWLGIQAPLDPRFHYFDDEYVNPNGNYIVDFLQNINAAYPDLTELIDIGNAWQGENGGYNRDMWVLRVTNEDPAFGPIEDKPPFFLFANIHAREVATPELAIRYIRYLTEGYLGEGGYGVDPDATWLVDWNVAYVLVMQNPDGHRVNEENTSAYRRKNMNNNECSGGNFGIDLNRNHSFLWGCCGGSSGDPCSETYRGIERGSEPETQAFENYFSLVMEDFNGPNGEDEIPTSTTPLTATGIFLSLHQYGDLVLWPWAPSFPSPPPDLDRLEVIGRKLSYWSTYEPAGDIGYNVDGATDDWTYGIFGIPSFTFEVGPNSGSCGGFFPAFECIDGAVGFAENFWAENRPAFLYTHKIARTPYMTAYGPDAEDVALAPFVVEPAQPTELSATIADHRYDNDPLQPIYGAEYFVDMPGEDGTGTPLAPADGAWGDLSEVVTATIDTTGLSLGRHYVLVHGLNDDGDWGPFTAAFLYVVEPGSSPIIEGYVRDADTLDPLDAMVTAEPFQTQTDPATGYYSMTVLSGTYDMSAFAANHAISTVTGVEAVDYQTTQQDFYLTPVCAAFYDNVEGGNLGWTADPPWAITDEASHSPDHSWTDSPGGDYGNYLNISLESPSIDLTGYEDVALSFWHIYDIESVWDHGYVEYSLDGGTTWELVMDYSGEGHLTWTQEEFPLPELDGQTDVRLRFRLWTHYATVADGWHIDDIALIGSGPACQPPSPPVADFVSNSPVTLGHTTVFTNLTGGTLPILYAWDFGDGTFSTVEHPTHTYAAAGLYTVTLAATNTVGTDTVSHPVVVEPCVAVGAVTISGALSGMPGVYTFTASVGPAGYTPPVAYLWDNGDTGDTSVRTLDLGSHTLVVTATNCLDALVTDDHSILIADSYEVYLPLVFKGVGPTGQRR